MKLNEIIPTLSPEQQRYLRFNYFSLYLPTEVVIRKPETLSPEIARAYTTDLYLIDEEIIPYDELRKHDNFKGAGKHQRIILLEVWIDQGSDGHIHHSMQGYLFTAETDMLFDNDRKYPCQFADDAFWESHRNS